MPHENVKPFHLERNPYHFRHFTVPDVKALLDEAGFELVWLGSQDDGPVRDETDGAFLIGEARMGETPPQATLAGLEAQIIPRQYEQMTRLGQTLARGVGIWKERDRLDTLLKERMQQLAEIDKAYGKAETARRILQQQQDQVLPELRELRAKAARIDAIDLRLNQLTDKLSTHRKLAQEAEKRVTEEGRARITRLEQEVRNLQRAQRETEQYVQRLGRQIWDHPAVRRLARFNWLGLKLLSVLGIGGAPPMKAPPLSRLPQAAAPAPAAAVKGGPALPRLGKQPVPDESLQEPHNAYVNAFSSLTNIYGVREKARSDRRIVVNVSRVFSEHLTGVGHYCDQLARALVRNADQEIVYYSGKTVPEWVLQWPGYPQFVHCPPAKVQRDPAKYGSAPTLESLAGKHMAYVDVSAAYYPLVQTDRRLTCIYDLAPISCPETVPDDIVKQCEADARFQAKHAGLLLAISEYSKREFCDITGVSAERVAVVPVGLDEVFRRPVSEGDRERVRQRYGLNRPFILCVGTLQPRKNLLRLVKAYGRLCESNPDMPQLVLTGTDKWAAMPEFEKSLERLHQKHAIEWTGYVDRLDMPALYNLCELFVYPSYFEGYGMPVAEAMASGAPVACGDRTSLPEVAGDAAVCFDPFDEEAIAAAIGNTLSDTALCASLREQSRARAETFLSWDAVATRYLDVMKPWLGS